MKPCLKIAAGVLIAIVVAEPALARGGGSSFMNSYGYQRRLQESRGLVTTTSNGYPYRRRGYYSLRHDNR